MEERAYTAYIVASRSHALQIGFTNDLDPRVGEHRSGASNGFASRYRCDRPVRFERFADPIMAITWEKELKGLTLPNHSHLLLHIYRSAAAQSQ